MIDTPENLSDGIQTVKDEAPSATTVVKCECGQEQDVYRDFCVSCGKDLK